MKRFELTFSFLQLPLDYLALILAGFSAYGLRFTEFMTSIKPVYFHFNLSWEKYWPLVLWVALGWTVIFAFAGLYHSNPNRKLVKDLSRVLFACSTGFAAITIFVFFTLQKFDSRFLVLAGWILAIAYVCLGRVLMRLIKYLLHRYGFGLRRTFIIGHEAVAEQIGAALCKSPVLGYAVVGVSDHFDKEALAKLKKTQPDEIIFTDPKAHEEQTIEAVEYAAEQHITFKYSADLFATISTNMNVSTIAGVPIIELGRTRLIGWWRIIKRTFDFLIAFVSVLVVSPLMLVVAIIILLETGRPIFYKNERVGQNGKKFFAYKFRSMRQKDCTGVQFGTDGEEALKKERELIKMQSLKVGPIYKIQNDPRLTPFGRFMRRWSLDELPQFFNVLKGDMSLIGPRPHQPREVAGYQSAHKIVHSVRPGLSGLAQISGRSNLSYEEEIKLDTFYLEHWSLIMDIIIMLKTPFAVVWRKGAL